MEKDATIQIREWIQWQGLGQRVLRVELRVDGRFIGKDTLSAEMINVEGGCRAAYGHRNQARLAPHRCNTNLNNLVLRHNNRLPEAQILKAQQLRILLQCASYLSHRFHAH